jgi:FkbM family methyltransferase
MNTALKKAIHRTLNRWGWVVQRYQPSTNPNAMLAHMLQSLRVDLVLDVGANQGQFASGLRQAGYQGRMLSFEPLREAHELLERAAGEDSLWTAIPRCAVGAEAGMVNMNVSENSYSSSILAMHDNLKASAPAARFIAQETAPMLTLDEMVAPHVKNGERCLLKIDTQGYEWEVLNGASATMENVVAICIETSLVPLYKGQRLWLDYIERLVDGGFVVWDIHSAFAAPTNGRLLQADLIFVKAELVSS